MAYLDSLNYSGTVPPEAPTVKALGEFTTLGGGRNAGIVFSTIEGVKLYTAHLIAPGVVMKLSALQPPVRVYVEGFVLKDGNGSFYPLKVASPTGIDMESPDVLMAELEVGRNPFHVQRLKSAFFFLIIPWVSLLFFAWRLRGRVEV